MKKGEEPPPKVEFPGGPLWTDKYDERLNPPSRFEWLWTTLRWLRDNVLASLIIAALSGAGGFALAHWLQAAPSSTSTPTSTP